MPLIIPVFSKTPNLFKELVRIVPNVTFHQVISPDNDSYFKKSEVVICDFDYLGPHLYDLPQTKWVQGTWAGANVLKPYVRNDTEIPYKITRFTGKHFGHIMGEYVVANIVNYERNLFKVYENQKNSVWNTDGTIHNYRVIYDLTIGILGLGNIGKRIGRMLHCFGAKIIAAGRKPELPTDDDYSFIQKYYPGDNLVGFLKECDYIVSILPGVPSTDGLLDGDILENCKDKKTVLINIGRGNLISEKSLLKALNNQWISGAILDVFSPEPLPSESPLWKMPQVVITPHVSGVSRAADIAEQFRENLELYFRNLPLPGVLDLTKGY